MIYNKCGLKSKVLMEHLEELKCHFLGSSHHDLFTNVEITITTISHVLYVLLYVPSYRGKAS